MDSLEVSPLEKITVLPCSSLAYTRVKLAKGKLYPLGFSYLTLELSCEMSPVRDVGATQVPAPAPGREEGAGGVCVWGGMSLAPCGEKGCGAEQHDGGLRSALPRAALRSPPLRGAAAPSCGCEHPLRGGAAPPVPTATLCRGATETLAHGDRLARELWGCPGGGLEVFGDGWMEGCWVPFLGERVAEEVRVGFCAHRPLQSRQTRRCASACNNSSLAL